MRAKPLLILLFCAAAAALAFWLFRANPSNSSSEQPNPAPAAAPNSEGASISGATHTPSLAQTSATPPVILTPPPFANTNPAPPVTPFILGSSDLPPPMDPSIVLGNLRNVIANYGSRYGGNPVGENADITRALNGDNPNGAKFITEESGLRINGRGELVDYWGTPFFFHSLSAAQMEIRSAGPDKQMWTADDLVTK
jgi:hypothetical protein